MKLFRNLLLTGLAAGALALVWQAANAGTSLDDERFPAPEADFDALSDEERDLLLRELAAHL